MFFNCITYSILRIIFADFFHIHQYSGQRPEITNLDEDELRFLLENFSLMMGRGKKLSNFKTQFEINLDGFVSH